MVPSNTYPIEFITSPAGEFQFSETVQRITQNIASHQYQYHHSLFKNIFSQTIHKDDNKEGFVLVDNLKRLTPFSPNIQSILTTMTINAQSNSIYFFSQNWTKFKMATIVVPNPNPAATQFETSITNTSPDWKTPSEKGESLSILGETIHHVHVTYKI